MSERDELEGRYTQAEPQTAGSRNVHGQYTEEAGAGPEEEALGTYVGTERDGSNPLTRSTHQRAGNYPKAEGSTPHPKDKPAN